MQRPWWSSGSKARASISWRHAGALLRLFKRALLRQSRRRSYPPAPHGRHRCKNIENNPMQSSGAIDTPSRECFLTRRANQLYHAKLVQIVRRIRPCSASGLPRFNARAYRTRSPQAPGRHRADLEHNCSNVRESRPPEPAASGLVRFTLFGLNTAAAIDHILGKAYPPR